MHDIKPNGRNNTTEEDTFQNGNENRGCEKNQVNI